MLEQELTDQKKELKVSQLLQALASTRVELAKVKIQKIEEIHKEDVDFKSVVVLEEKIIRLTQTIKILVKIGKTLGA